MVSCRIVESKKQTKNVQYRGKLIDLILDRRMPYWLPYALIRKLWLQGKMRRIDLDLRSRNIFTALTFDIEQDFGSKGEQYSSESTREILLRLNEEINDKKLTFFIQGNLVQDLADLLHILSKKGHELGLHGFEHKSWGKSKWFLKKMPLDSQEKAKRLGIALASFEKHNLDKPISFRAPDLTIDSESLKLLERHSFQVDSSLPAYMGVLPIPRYNYGWSLIRIPVTATPIPRFSSKYLLPYSFYTMFDMANLRSMDDSQFLKFVKDICSIQHLYGYPNHLVFLAHSWEFTDWGCNYGSFRYCSHENVRLLNEKISVLEEEFNVEFVTMLELSNILRSINEGHL